MKILHLAYADSSGVPTRWAEAHRAAGHDALLLLEASHPFRYQGATTVLRWTPGSESAADRVDRIASVVEWADVVMAYDHPFYLDAAIATGKPVLFRALGQSARDHHEEIRELLAAPNVVRATAGLAEIAALLDIPLVGAPYPLLRPARPASRSVLCHAPADRDAKRTAVVLEAARQTGWHVDLIEGVANAEVIRRKRRAALVVDSGPVGVPDGYGVNSIEAMSLGLPAISGASRPVRERMAEAGSPVVLVETAGDLRAALERLHDPAVRRDLGAAGREFVRRFHSASDRAAEDLAAVRETFAVAA